MVDEFFEDGGGDVIRYIGDDFVGTWEVFEGELEEVCTMDCEIGMTGEMFGKEFILFNGEDMSTRFEEGGGEGAGAWADFKDMIAWLNFSQRYDFANDVPIDEKVLRKRFQRFGSDSIEIEEQIGFFHWSEKGWRSAGRVSRRLFSSKR